MKRRTGVERIWEGVGLCGADDDRKMNNKEEGLIRLHF